MSQIYLSPVPLPGTLPASEEMITLQNERERGKALDVEKMATFIYGGSDALNKRRKAYQRIEQEPLLNISLREKYDSTRLQLRESGAKKVLLIGKLLTPITDPEEERAMVSAISSIDRSLGMRWFIHTRLWLETITSQGTPEQVAKWIPPSQRLEVRGCFGMTELGHSSFLRGLETTATFDRATDSLVISSPTLTSTKLWQGFAGQLATHCLVLSRLIVGDADHGVQLVIVPIRDPLTGKPLPGVSVHDMGPKAGLNAIDNGCMVFTGVRVPRENMLMRWSSLDRDGNFSKPPFSAIAYGATITERVVASVSAYHQADNILTIALRYSLIRRQGPNDEQIIDYFTQQHRLYPHLATSFAVRFAAHRLYQTWDGILEQLRAGDESSYVSELPEIHALSCGMKAFTTWWTTDALEAGRRALGGHAFSSYSGVPSIIADFGVNTTGGGDNIVIAQQTAKYLTKVFAASLDPNSGFSDNVKPSSSIAYFFKIAEYLKPSFHTRLTQINDPDVLFAHPEFVLEALAVLSLRKLSQGVKALQKSKAQGHDAWNLKAPLLVEAVRFHIFHYIFQANISALEQADSSLRPVLSVLHAIFSTSFLLTHASDFLEASLLTIEHLSLLRELLNRSFTQLRPFTAVIVDSLDIPDITLGSALGRKDGDIYRAYVHAMRSSVASTDIVPYWSSLPLLKSKL